MCQILLKDALKVFSENIEAESFLLRKLKQINPFFLSQDPLNIGYAYKSQTSFANTKLL